MHILKAKNRDRDSIKNSQYILNKKLYSTKFVKILGMALVFSLLYLINSSSVFAATYYVDFTDGNDTNDGLTTTTPWKNLTKASNASSSAPGDTILFQRGETWAGKLTINESGSSGGITTYGAYGTGVNPIINASGQTYGIDIQGKSYLRFENLTVQNATTGQFLILGSLSDIALSGVTTSGGVYGVYILNGTNSNISLTNTSISGFSTSGIEIANTLNGLSLTGVTISSGPIGLNIGGTVSSLTIDSSNLSSLTNNGVQSASTAPITTFTITNSHFDSNTNSGLFLQGNLTGLTISDSFFNSNTSSSGIRIQPGAARVVTTVNISNTQANNNGGTGITFGGTGSGTGITMSNVTGTGNTGGGLLFQRSWTSVGITGSAFSTNSSDGVQFNLDNAAAAMSTINIGTTTASGNTASGFQFLGTTGAGSGVTLTNITASSNHVDGINVKGNWSTVNINHCTANSNGVDGSSGDGDGISYHNSTTGSITKCFVSNNIKSAIAHVGSSNLDMSYNVFRNDTNGTIPLAYVEGTGTYTFYNNVIYSGGQTGTCLQISTPTGPSVTIKNNIIYGCNKGIEKIAGTVTEDYNIVYNSVTGWTGLTQGSHSVTSNPLLRNVGSNNFTLLSSSPAINTGTNVSLTSDYTDNLVPQGTVPDIGAFEFLVPASISSLAQYQSDGTSSIGVGSGTDSNSIVLKFSMSSTNESDLLTPQVEVREVGTAFTNTVTNSGSALVYSGSSVTGTVIVTDLSSAQNYHWQARSSNSAGQSSWLSYGSNSESVSDFYSDSVPPTGSININSSDSYTTLTSVTLSLSTADDIDTTNTIQMQISNNSDFSTGSYESFSASKTWNLTSGNGTKTVYIRFRDAGGNVSSTYSDSILKIDSTPSTNTEGVNSSSENTVVVKIPSNTSQNNDEEKNINNTKVYLKLKIIDQNGNPLPNANIIIDELNINAVTNEYGIINVEITDIKDYKIEIEYKGEKFEKILAVSKDQDLVTIKLDIFKDTYTINWVLVIIVTSLILMFGYIYTKRKKQN